MRDQDKIAILEYLQHYSHLQKAYETWIQNPDSSEWVNIIFPGWDDTTDKPSYVLMNCLYVQCDERNEKMIFQINKLLHWGENLPVTVEEVPTLNCVEFYERFSLPHLQSIGI